MGILDKLGSETESISPRAALLLAAITMSAIDGNVEDDELAVIRRLDGTGNTDAWDEAVRVWKANSIEDCIPLVVNALDSSQQLLTIANLVDIAMADGVLGGAEKTLIEVYFDAFDVSEDDFQTIVNVTAIKNDQSIFS